MANPNLARHDVDADASHPRGRPAEVLLDEVGVEADRLEDLCPVVALDRRDAHLRDHLHHALVRGAHVLLLGRLWRDPREQLSTGHVVERLEHQVGIDGARAVPDEKREVVDLARLPRLQDQPHPRSQTRPGSARAARRRPRAATGWPRSPVRSPGPTGRRCRSPRGPPGSCARHSSSTALSSPGPPSRTPKSIGSVTASEAARRSRAVEAPQAVRAARSAGSASRSSICRHCSGVPSRRFPSGPMVVSTPITSSSRMASTGGFVTCAKSCLK